MSIQIDLNSIGDLIALHGTEADRRAWLRIRADRDELRRQLLSARQCLGVAVIRERMAEGARAAG